MADLHRFQRRYQSAITSLWKSNLSKEDKEGIEQFLHDKRARNMGYARLIKLCDMLRMLGEKLSKHYEKATELDLQRLVYAYENADYSFWTKHEVKVIIKQYYAWLNKGEYPKLTEKYNGSIITISRDSQTFINPLDLLGHTYAEKRLALMDMFRVMFGELSEIQKAKGVFQ